MADRNWAEATPREIDEILAKLWEMEGRKLNQMRRVPVMLERWERDVKALGLEMALVRNCRQNGEEAAKELEAKLKADIAWLHEMAAPLEAEHRARRWNRYFLVTNTGGHIHRERNCTTCFVTTQYGWLIELADCDEAAMVAEHGERACTICFPDAPTMQGWGKAVEMKAARDGKCLEKRYHPGERSDRRWSYRYGLCVACGTYAAITKADNLRKHKIDPPKKKA